MLLFAHSLKELRFYDLMEIYVEGNREKARKDYRGETPERGIALVEQDFYQYLRECFFPTPGARYAVWIEKGKYVSALRLEPYRDGLLLAALETAPDYRNKGYATMLVRAVLSSLQKTKVYSHVNKGNIPSLKTHAACGFNRIGEHAVYADGSVLHSSCTLCREIE